MIFCLEHRNGGLNKHDGNILDWYDPVKHVSVLVFCERCFHWMLRRGDYRIKYPCRCKHGNL